MVLFKSTIVFLEIVLFLSALTVLFIKRHYPILEGFCYALILVLCIYSTTIQLSFILGIFKYYYFFDIFILIFSLFTIVNNITTLQNIASKIIDKSKKHYILLSLFLLAYSYLFCQVLLLPANNNDSLNYNLGRVLLMLNEGNIFLKNYTSLRQVIFPLGYDILSFLFLRFSSDYFLSFFSLLSYAGIITGTYSLVKRIFQDDRLSLVTALIISSLPEIVLQATSTKNDIGTAFCAVTSLLACCTLINSRDKYCLLIIVMSLLLGVSFKTYFPGFALPFLILFFLAYGSRHSFLDLLSKFKLEKRYWLTYLLIVGLVFCLSSVFWHNYFVYRGFLGDPRFVSSQQNKDGLTGAAANSFRYLVQAIEYPRFFGGGYLNRLQETIFKEKGKWAGRDKIDLSSKIVPNEDYTWYGLLGVLLIFPSLLYTLFRGPGFIRLTAATLLTFFVTVCYTIGWMPWNNRFFSLFFAVSGINVAYVLSKLSWKKCRIIVLVALASLYFTALFNESKPFFNVYEIGYLINRHYINFSNFQLKERYNYTVPGPFVLNWMYFIRNREINYSMKFNYNNDLLQKYCSVIRSRARILILGNDFPCLPLLLYRTDLTKVISSPGRIFFHGSYLNIDKPQQFQTLANHFDYMLIMGDDLKEAHKKFKLLAYDNRKMDSGCYFLYELPAKP